MEMRSDDTYNVDKRSEQNPCLFFSATTDVSIGFHMLSIDITDDLVTFIADHFYFSTLKHTILVLEPISF